MRDFVGQMDEAAIDLFRQWLIVRWGTAHRRRDVRIPQREPIVDMLRGVQVREVAALERGHQEVARRSRAVTRENAPRAVRAVRGRGEAEDQHACLRIAETGHRARPVMLVAKGCFSRPADFPAVRPEPWALLAGDDGRLNGRKRRGRHVLSLQHVTSRRCCRAAFNSIPIPIEWSDCHEK